MTQPLAATPHVLWFVDGLPSLAWVASASAQAAALVVAVLALRAALGRHLTPGWRLALWTIVLLRLVVPLAVESRWSLVGVARRMTSIATREDVAVATATPRPAEAPRVSITYGPIPNAPRDVAVPRATPDAVARVAPLELAVDAWLVGVALLVAWQMAGAIRLRRAVGRMRAVDDAATLALAARCAREVGVRRPVRLVETDRLRAPAVCGIVRPAILLPAGVADALSRSELRLVLLHELAHVRRDDALIAAIARLARAFHWFNPLVWIGVSAFRADRELACDAAVLRVVGDAERRAYGECLLHVVERLSGLPRHPATLGVFGSSRHLRTRIDMIAVRPSRTPVRRIARAAFGGAVVLTIGAAAALGESKPNATTKPDAAEKVADVAAKAADVAATAPASQPAGDVAETTVLPELRFDAVPFTDAIDFLRDATSVPIVVNWNVLNASGIDKDVPVTLRVSRVSLSKAISLVIAQGGAGVTRLDFRVDRGVVTISTTADLATDIQTRAYDIRDLSVDMEDFGETTTRPAATSRPTRAERVRQIIDVIQATIEPDTWKANGGLIGAIQELSGQLIVTSTPSVQRQVSALLGQLRENRAVQVNVESRFILVDATLVPTLLGREAVKPGDVDRAADASHVSGTFLDEEQAARLLRSFQLAAAGTSTLTAPRVTLFNGQRAFVKVATPQRYIAGFALTKTKAGENRYEPVMDNVETGMTTSIQATVSADHAYVTVTVHPKLTTLARMETMPFLTDASGKGELTVQRPTLDVQEMETTFSVPDRGTVLLTAGGAGGKDGKQLLLALIKPTVIVQRAVEQPAFPQRVEPK